MGGRELRRARGGGDGLVRRVKRPGLAMEGRLDMRS